MALRQWPVVAGLVVLVLALGFAGRAGADTFVPCCNPQALADAITAANANPGPDTIQLAVGTYHLSGLLTSGGRLPSVNDQLTLLGDPASPTVIDGDGLHSRILLLNRGATLDHLTIRGGCGVEDEALADQPVTITNSTIADNPCGGFYSDAGNVVTLINDTITGNGSGGGFGNFGIRIDTSNLVAVNDTISNNVVGLYMGDSGAQSVVNTIIAGNFTADCASYPVVADHSIDGDGTCTTGFIHADPKLDPLASNGGPVQTQALLPGSPAIDTGTSSGCPATDARGFARVGACDIGAYEFGASASVPPNTPAGASVSVSPAPGVTLTFSNVTTAGTTTATPVAPSFPVGFQVDGVVYDITTTASFSGSIVVCLPYDPVTNPTPYLQHFEGGVWVMPPQTVDSVRQVVCATVTSLSPFGVFRDTQAPSIAAPADLTVEANTTGGANVGSLGSPTVSDNSGGSVTVTHSPSGSFFPLGTTTVTWTATDPSGNSAQAVQHVTVRDTTAPTLTVPASPVTATATGPTPVTFTVTATDIADANPSISCDHPSGSVFPLGTTHVTCTATDASHNSSAPGSFDVVINAPPDVGQQLRALQELIDSFNLGKKPEKKFDHLLNKAEKAWEKGHIGKLCEELGDFTHDVVKQTGNSLTPTQATQLLQAASRIQAQAGC